jgi:hypothetical protein
LEVDWLARGMTPKTVSGAGLLALGMAVLNLSAQGQGGGRGGPPPGPPPTPRAAARIDITGYWVSLITEDWRYRQFTPPKGDYEAVLISAAGRQIGDAWDPARDEAGGEQCKVYGAAGLMRLPTRLHITWQDDKTLKLEADAGTQTRLFHFGGPEPAGGDWQGASMAVWEFPQPPMRPSYLRKNGVPYSAQTVMTEYFDRLEVPGGDTILLVTTEVNDPLYLSQPLWISTHFKKQNDATGWNPTPCTAR